ncbi:MAG: cytochrome o ubiquinol oxidase subunit III [Candidatus Saccharimonadales bacterium]
MSLKHDLDTETVSLGFWIYLMTDCLLFASLFATYAVLRNGTAGSVSGSDIFDMNYVLWQTLALLTSSVTSGFALLSARARQYNSTLLWLLATIILGAIFLGLELNEFRTLISDGHGWQTSAFLSAFFTLVGAHGLHIISGLIWATVLVCAFVIKGITERTIKKLVLFTLFWHFLDIIWIFIFTFVYAIGSVG